MFHPYRNVLAHFGLVFFLRVHASGAEVQPKPASTCVSSYNIVLVQDLTTSFKDDIIYFQQNNIFSQAAQMLQERKAGSRMGLVTFKDKPYLPAGTPSDYCSFMNLHLTSDSHKLASAYSLLLGYGGADPPEAQLSALMQAIEDPAMGWNPPTLPTLQPETQPKTQPETQPKTQPKSVTEGRSVTEGGPTREPSRRRLQSSEHTTDETLSTTASTIGSSTIGSSTDGSTSTSLSTSTGESTSSVSTISVQTPRSHTTRTPTSLTAPTTTTLTTVPPTQQSVSSSVTTSGTSEPSSESSSTEAASSTTEGSELEVPVNAVILLTDSTAHYAGDGTAAGLNLRPFNEAVARTEFVSACLGEDYPPRDTGYLARKASDRGINFGFFIHDETANQTTRKFYQEFLRTVQPIQEAISVKSLTANSDNFLSLFGGFLDDLDLVTCSAARTTTPMPTTTDPVCGKFCTVLPPASGLSMKECVLREGVNFVDASNVALYAIGTWPMDLYYPPVRPQAIFYPRDEATVVKVVKCAEETDANLVVRSGGHDYAGYSYGQTGDYILDLRLMDSIEIDNSRGIVKVGAGIRVSPLNFQLNAAGPWMLPSGACTSVGVGGHATGGGYGYYSRHFGLLTDRITSARLVLANGTVVTASGPPAVASLNDAEDNVLARAPENGWPAENPDVFWALRGGGAANWGVVTELTFLAAPAAPVYSSATLVYPLTALGQLLTGMVALIHSAPKELAFSLVVSPIVCGVQTAFPGNWEEHYAALQPFIQVAGPAIVDLHRTSDFITSFAELSITDIVDTETPVNFPPVLPWSPPSFEQDIIHSELSLQPETSLGVYDNHASAELSVIAKTVRAVSSMMASDPDWSSKLNLTDFQGPQALEVDRFLTSPSIMSIRKVADLGQLNTSASFEPPRTFWKSKSFLWGDTTNELNATCIQRIVDNVYLPLPPNFGFAVETWGGPSSSITAIPQNATAFSNRNSTFIAHFYARSYFPLASTETDFLDNFALAIQDCATPQVYLNYNDRDLGEDTIDWSTRTASGSASLAWPRYFGANLERLQKIKNELNPTNAFWFPQALRPGYQSTTSPATLLP